MQEGTRYFGLVASDPKHVSFDPRTCHLTARSHDVSDPQDASLSTRAAARCHRGGTFVEVGSRSRIGGSLERGALENGARIPPAEQTVVERTVLDREKTRVPTVQKGDGIEGHVDVADLWKGRGRVAAAVPNGSTVRRRRVERDLGVARGPPGPVAAAR